MARYCWRGSVPRWSVIFTCLLGATRISPDLFRNFKTAPRNTFLLTYWRRKNYNASNWTVQGVSNGHWRPIGAQLYPLLQNSQFKVELVIKAESLDTDH